MATSKKSSKKKAAKKGTKKAAASAKSKLTFAVDAEKAEAIKRCLAKGSLTVTATKAGLSGARLADPYLWD